LKRAQAGGKETKLLGVGGGGGGGAFQNFLLTHFSQKLYIIHNSIRHSPFTIHQQRTGDAEKAFDAAVASDKAEATGTEEEAKADPEPAAPSAGGE